MARRIEGTVLAALALVLGSCAEERAAVVAKDVEVAPRNVVFFVGDGCGWGAWSVGRAVAKSRGIEFVFDHPEALGLIDTHSEDELVTDSAAAATAWAIGRLGRNGVVGMPGVPNLFERLAAAKRAAGFITTTRVTHGTLAPFYSRNEDRGDEADIAQQMIRNLPTIVVGGGLREFLPKSEGGEREDGRDLLATLDPEQVAVMREFAQPFPVGKKALALLSVSHMAHETDREGEPDLAEMVVAALGRLKSEPLGWFLLVEEGRIDHAGHSHDAASLARNVLRLDRAVAAALKEVDLAQTMVIVTADHGTGNPNLHESARPDSLDSVSMSVERISARIFGGEKWRGTPAGLEAKALPILSDGARHTGLRPVDLDRLLTAKDESDRQVALGTAISRRFGISWMPWDDRLESTKVGGHTGDLVPVLAWGTRAEDVRGVRDHAALGRWLAELLALAPPDTAATAAAPAAR